jgi:hypothetical protein
MNIKDFVTKGNTVRFDSFRAGVFYYNVAHIITGALYEFQVPIEDTGGATFKAEERSVTMMRWIRKSIESGTFIKI